VAAATLLQVAAVTTGGGTSPARAAETLVAALGLLQGLLLLAMRRRPGLAAIAVCVGYAGQAALAGTVLPAAPWVALVGLTAVPGAARMLAVALVALGAGFGLGAISRPASAGTLPLLVAVTAVLVLAGVVRSARQARAGALAAQREEAKQRLASQERLALARELHDAIGHGLSTIAVQSSAARMALDAGRADSALRALSAVESSSRATMREMRELVTVLRGPAADLAPRSGLDDLPALVERIRESGVAARLSVADGLQGLPAGTQATVYRIVQEGLTNVVRHAAGAWAEAGVEREGNTVVVAVQDGGGRVVPPAAADGAAGGYGLAGLRERVQLVGGTLDAGPAGAGWRLSARLPVGEAT
jgi:signal transduction histidine kinase